MTRKIHSGGPERLARLVLHVGPRQADIVQHVVVQHAQLVPLLCPRLPSSQLVEGALACLAGNVERRAEQAENMAVAVRKAGERAIGWGLGQHWLTSQVD